jgi:hypothetical protein
MEIKSYNVVKIIGNSEKKMQARDIISYFSPYYFNCHTGKSTKIKLGEKI